MPLAMSEGLIKASLGNRKKLLVRGDGQYPLPESQQGKEALITKKN